MLAKLRRLSEERGTGGLPARLGIEAPAEPPTPPVDRPARPDLARTLMARLRTVVPAPVDVRALALQRLKRFMTVPQLPALTAPSPVPRPSLFAGVGAERSRRARTPAERAEGLQRLGDLLGSLIDAPQDSTPRPASRTGVPYSPELDRIVKLPRRPPDPKGAPDLTERFAKPGGTMRLWPIQSWALDEAPRSNGLLAPIAVGAGKTLISLLLPEAMGSKRAVLLVPPQLRAQLLKKDIPELFKAFWLSLDRLKVVAYSELSNARSADILEQLSPDLIIADECHGLRHRSSARTKRFLRYFKEHPGTRFVGLSGTMTRRSIKDYAHLSELALRKGSPLPFGYHELADWADAIDVSNDPIPPGELLRLCNEEERGIALDPGRFKIADKMAAAQSAVRSGFRRRLVDTPGVVSTEESAVGTSLIIEGLHPKVPENVLHALRRLEQTWEIEGEELGDALSVSRVARQLACGFFYRWQWPDGIKDEEWLRARNAWSREVREILKHSRAGLDSPLLVARAAAAGRIKTECWASWEEVRSRPEPPREAIWIDDFLVRETIGWAATCSAKEGGIIWYVHDAFGQRAANDGGLPWYGPGAEASAALTAARPDRQKVIVCSIAAHGTGKNLQRYCRNLVTTPPAGGVEWEQMLARTHRPGQLADEVWVNVFLHTEALRGALDQALADAAYIEQSQGQRQKLLLARRLT